jgi:hypothetical protein
MWTANHRDRVFVSLRQREQPPRDGQYPADQGLGNLVPGQVEESDLVGHLAQARPQLIDRVAQIHFRQRGDAWHSRHPTHRYRR